MALNSFHCHINEKSIYTKLGYKIDINNESKMENLIKFVYGKVLKCLILFIV